MKFTLINYCWEVNGLTVTIKDKITKKQWPLLKEHMTLSQEIKPKQLPFIRLSAINTVYLSTWLMKETKKKKTNFNEEKITIQWYIKDRWMQIY